MPYKEPEMQKLWRELHPEKGRQYRRTFYERHPDLKPKPRAASKMTPEQKAAAKVIREANPIWQARKAARKRGRAKPIRHGSRPGRNADAYKAKSIGSIMLLRCARRIG